MTNEGVFHPGERAVQDRAGERALADRNGRIVNDAIVSNARRFLGQQQMIALASQDSDNRVWASLCFGPRGFVSAPDERRVMLDRACLAPSTSDPYGLCLRQGMPLGMLAIELATRRRLRINGVVSALSPSHIEVAVREAYPNCPKYIQRRERHARIQEAPEGPARHGIEMEPEQQQAVLSADTLFVASSHPQRGLDCSHRGGHAGFVRVVSPRILRIPDYAGNGMYNTLGNFLVDPRAGVVVPDFEHGRLLQLTGTATLCFGVEDPHQPTGGTGRYWELSIDAWRESPMLVTDRWELRDESGYNPQPGA